MAVNVERTQAERVEAIRPLLPKFRERMRMYDEAAEFPVANFEDLRESRLLALTAPREHGGDQLLWDTKFTDFYEILETIAAADSSTAQLLQVHSHALTMLAWHATEAQRGKYLREIIDNGLLVSSAGSEANPAAKAPEEYVAELVETPNGWELTCNKHFVSLGPGASYYLVWVAVPGAGSYADRQVWVLVPRDAPGVELINEWDTMGMRPTVSWALKTERWPVPEDAIIGEPGSWVHRDPRSFTLAYVANHLGTAQGAFDFTVEWVRERQYLAQSEIVRVNLGDMASQLYATRSGMYNAARLWDHAGAAGWEDPVLAGEAEQAGRMALHVAKHTALEVTRKVFDICGARGTFRMYPLDVMFRDVRTFTLHFRDELYMMRVADDLVSGVYTGKAGSGGSVPQGRRTGAPVPQA